MQNIDGILWQSKAKQTTKQNPIKQQQQSKMTTIQEVQQVNIQCECHHRHGPLFLLRPWAWGAPCRRCERMMERSNVVVVPSPPTAAAITVTSTSSSRRRRGSPVVITTTTQAPPPAPIPQQQQQQQQVVTVTPAQTAAEWQAAQLPPRYEVSVAQ